MVLLIAIIIGVICADQLTKWLAVIYLQGQPSFPLWQDVLHFTFAKNEGAAFGILSEQRWVFMVFSLVAIVALLVYLFRSRPKSRLIQITLAMIIGGGIGNMIDRILLGYVVDFIDFTLINFAIFNVADSFITVGSFLLMGYLIYEIVHEFQSERQKKQKVAEKADHSSTTESNTAEQTDHEND